MSGHPSESSRGFPVGSDQVLIEEHLLIIHARHPFPDWKVREFCRHPIYFRDRKYFIRSRCPAEAPFAMRYELAPWPADLHEESSLSFIYDPVLVRARDESLKLDRHQDRLYYLLMPFYPVLGYCWSKFKTRVLAPLGFAADSITSASTMLSLCLAILDAFFLVYLGGGFIALVLRMIPRSPGFYTAWVGWLDLGFLLIIIADCITRYGGLIRNPDQVDGFLEWAARWFKAPDDGQDRS